MNFSMENTQPQYCLRGVVNWFKFTRVNGVNGHNYHVGFSHTGHSVLEFSGSQVATEI